MPLKPQFYKQETLYSCVPACLRMVLSSYEFLISEAELRSRCDCTEFGTDPFLAVLAARELGFENTRTHTLTLSQLAVLITDEIYPYVEVNMAPIDGNKTAHALVIVGVDEKTVTVYDPLLEPRVVPLGDFILAWAMRGNLATLVLK